VKISVFMTDILMNVDCYTLLRAIRAINDVNYDEISAHKHEILQGIYILNYY